MAAGATPVASCLGDQLLPQRGSPPAWRTCIDFGTAASKASTCAPWAQTGRLTYHVHPLRIGAICNEPNPFVAQSALLFDGPRIYFGWNALKHAASTELATDVLHSFKTFLAAADLQEALRLRLKRSVDRSGAFSQRDALVLYVSYLLYLTEHAFALDPSLPAEARACPRRYAYPTWRAGADANTIMAGIFDAAASVAVALGDDLASPRGVDLERARAALDTAGREPGSGRIEAGVYEAQAAAECHFAFTHGLPDHVMVFDMGAGTTDITAFERREEGGVSMMREMTDARRTILLACDEIDKLLVSYILERVKTKQKNLLKQFWRTLMLRARHLKEELFRKGSCEVRCDQQRIYVRLSDFMRDRQFAAFRAALASNFRSCLTHTSLRAVAAGSDEVGVVLAGGGAALPFIQDMAKHTRPTSARIRRISVQPLVPEWAADETFKRQLAPIFPQVAISIGGAVAHVHATDLHF
jgi:molecular chaperone DnaK (HSP70)